MLVDQDDPECKWNVRIFRTGNEVRLIEVPQVDRSSERKSGKRTNMKNTMLATAGLLGALLGAASAQTVPAVRVTLPYAASVGGVTLPAGEYTVRDVHDEGAGSALQISGDDGRSIVVMAMQIVAPKNQQVSDAPRVELKLTDAGYQIQTIWLAGREVGYEIVGSH